MSTVSKSAATTQLQTDQIIRVRRQWNDWRAASVHLTDLSELHWDDVSGGIRERAPSAFLHGYLSCNKITEGKLSHSCKHGKGPHRIKVCILEEDNDPALFEALTEQADRQEAGARRSSTWQTVLALPPMCDPFNQCKQCSPLARNPNKPCVRAALRRLQE